MADFMERMQEKRSKITRIFKKGWNKDTLTISSRKVKVNETMITEAMGLPMDGIKFYRDRKLSNVAVKKFPKDEEENARLAKGSHTYYSPKVIKLIWHRVLFAIMEFITLDERFTRVYNYHFVILNHFRYKEKISIPYYLFCVLNVGIKDVISNPKTNPTMHEGLMVILYNHIKNTIVHLNITKVSESDKELEDSEDDDGEGYDTEVDVEDQPHITGSSKRRRKIGQEDQSKGSTRRKHKGEDEES